MRAVVQPLQIAPGRWALPRLPDSDPAALRRLADDCRELHAALGGAARDAQWVIADVRRDWTGQAANAAPRPLVQLDEGAKATRAALDRLADELERLAAALERAEDAHGWSWRKVAAVSAVVAVTAGAVVVTVGTAGTASPGAAVAETAVVSAAAGEMAAATASAAAAEATAVEGLLVAARLARTVEALRTIVVPRVVLAAMKAPVWLETPLGSAAVGATSTAVSEYVSDQDIDPLDVAFSALLGAGESLLTSPGRGQGYVELTNRRLAMMDQASRRRDLLRIMRARFPQDSRPLSFPTRQMETHHKHAHVFGVPSNFNPANSARLENTMRDFVSAPSTVRINGTWKRAPAIIYTDYDSSRTIVCHPDGSFWTAMKIVPAQRWHLWHDQSLGGGK